MANLRKARKRFTAAAIILAVLGVAAIGFLLSPLSRSRSEREAEWAEARRELQAKKADAVPLRGMDKKIVLAKNEIGGFYKDRFAATDSELANELGKLAAQNGIRIQQASYKQEDAEGSGIIPVEIHGGFSGDYLQLVRFINTLERSKMFFMVDGVELAGEGAGPVKLGITIHSYLRSGA